MLPGIMGVQLMLSLQVLQGIMGFFEGDSRAHVIASGVAEDLGVMWGGEY